jgi:hypothetical protein
MIDYRAYVLDGNGHIHDRIEFKAAGDPEALTLACRYLDGRDIELWRGDRRVGAIRGSALRTGGAGAGPALALDLLL